MNARRAWQDIKRNWRYNLTSQLASTSVLIGTFTVFALAMLIHQNIETLLSRWGQDVKAHVYMTEESTDADTAKVREFIQGTRLFQNPVYLSKDDAAAKFKSRAGELIPDLLSNLDFQNPLPASYELQVRGGMDSRSAYHKIVEWAKKMKAFSGVEDVSYGQGWVENYSSALHVFTITSWGFLVMILFGSLFVVGNSIRNAIHQRGEEIAVMELFGATRKDVIVPYVIEGLVTGFVASGLALLMSYLIFQWQSAVIIEQLAFLNLNNKLDFLTWARAVLLVFTGGGIGALAAYIWASQLATGWAAAEAAQ